MICSSEEIDHQRKEEDRGKIKDLPRLTGTASLADRFHEGAGVI